MKSKIVIIVFRSPKSETWIFRIIRIYITSLVIQYRHMDFATRDFRCKQRQNDSLGVYSLEMMTIVKT